MIDPWAKNFKMEFIDFRSHATNVRTFERPFSVGILDVPEKLQLELTELQCDSNLRSSFNQEDLIYLLYFSVLRVT